MWKEYFGIMDLEKGEYWTLSGFVIRSFMDLGWHFNLETLEFANISKIIITKIKIKMGILEVQRGNFTAGLFILGPIHSPLLEFKSMLVTHVAHFHSSLSHTNIHTHTQHSCTLLDRKFGIAANELVFGIYLNLILWTFCDDSSQQSVHQSFHSICVWLNV